MSSTARSVAFKHVVQSSGAARGLTISGRQTPPERRAARADTPLIIALHGGTYTSAYFDLPGYSLLDRAAANGIAVVALDRPGYGGSTPLPPADATILKNAEVLNDVIGELWTTAGEGAAGVVLVGHSIGGAIVTAIAANHPAWPLLGIATSGCLLEVPADSRGAWAALPDLPMIDLPTPLKDGVMFGPAWTFDPAMPAASHAANAPVPRAELIDITTTWVAGVRATAARVRVPVHHRQGEFDHLWITDAAQVDGYRAAFTAAGRVDVALLASAGHCIDFHRLGAAFQLEQLAFALQCCVAAR